MFMPPPEVAALAQAMQPTAPLFQILEGYKDLQSVVAVLEAQKSFLLDHNQARFSQSGPLDLPDHERIRYLGFFLLQDLDLQRPLKIQLQFHSRFAYTPLVLMLRAFGLQGKHQIRLTQGLVLHEEASVNLAGLAHFVFAPLGELLKHPERVTGFLVYLIRPVTEPEPSAVLEAAEALPDSETGVVRAEAGLNVYKKIDTRV